MEDSLKLSDYVIMCSEFEQDPENIDKLEEIKEFISQIEIREYLSLKEKELVAMDILTSISSDFDAPGSAAFLETGRVVKGLLAYCVNIVNDLPLISYNYFVPDSIYEYGLYDAIISRCEKDYERLNRMIDSMISIDNIYKLSQTAQLFNEKSYNEWINNMKELKDTLDSESLRSLLEVITSDSEGGKDLLGTLSEVIVEQTNKEMEAEAKKFEEAADFIENSKEENEDELTSEDKKDSEEGDSKHVS